MSRAGDWANPMIVRAIAQRAARGFQLARYHHFSQFVRRLWNVSQIRARRVLPLTYRPKATLCQWKPGAEKRLQAMFDRRRGLWPSRSDSEQLARLKTGVFDFLNCPIDLRSDSGDNPFALNWQPKASRLWRFHLHSQEFLIDVAADDPAAAWQIIDSWLTNPPHQSPYDDPDAWHPFCISRRLPVWMMVASVAAPPESLCQSFWRSVAEQAQWLADHLERDLGGNHLLENLHASLLAICLLSGDWKIDAAKLVQLLQQQIAEQVSLSGEHCERTPTYHALMLLSLVETAESLRFIGHPAAANLHECASRMAAFLRLILHPDGQIPLFADSVLAETPEPSLLLSRIDLPPTPASTASADYWTWRSDDDDFLICDLGPLACDHLPAHGHADLFTVEASIRGRRLLVDTGTFCYEASKVRSYCRGSSAHNTLQVDGEDHADTWSSFRMGRRGHPLWKKTGASDGRHWMLACHDAYRHRSVPRSGRLIVASHGPIWIIIDWIVGQGIHRLTSRLNLHPSWSLSASGLHEAKLSFDSGDSADLEIRSLDLAQVRAETGSYCPNFGVRHETTVLVTEREVVDVGWVGWHLGPFHSQQAAQVSLDRNELSVRLADGWALRGSLLSE